MKQRLVCIGNSHLASTKKVLESCCNVYGLEPIFVPLNWVDLYDLIRAKEKLNCGEVASIKVNNPSGSFAVEFAFNHVAGFVTSGAPFGGPGELFRVIASKSFTGSFDGVPSPNEVACCYTVSKRSELIPLLGQTLPRGLQSSSCLKAIFDHSHRLNLESSLSKLFVELAAIKPLVHIPTPPMPSNTVIRRFGRHVYESNLGALMNSSWADVTQIKRNGVTLLRVPKNCTDNGWLKASYTANGHPTLDIHANETYGLSFEEDLSHWFPEWC